MQLIWGSQNSEQGQHDLACIAIQIHPASSSNTLVPLTLHEPNDFNSDLDLHCYLRTLPAQQSMHDLDPWRLSHYEHFTETPSR